MGSNYTEGAGGLVKERVNKLQQNFWKPAQIFSSTFRKNLFNQKSLLLSNKKLHQGDGQTSQPIDRIGLEVDAVKILSMLSNIFSF